MSNLSREFAADIEIRSDGTGRTVHGIVVPYGQVARVSDGGPAYDEMFASGAFSRDLQARAGDYSRVKLLFQHDSNNPIGRATNLREEAAGLYGEFQITPEAARGGEALSLLRDGVLDSFSVGFRGLAHERRDGIVVRTKAALREASLVTFPAYAGALVGGLRALATEDRPAAIALLAQIAAAEAALDPFVDALCAADCSLDVAQAWLAEALGVASPDPEDGADMTDAPAGMDPSSMADGEVMQMSDSLTNFARAVVDRLAERAANPTADGHSGLERTADPDPADEATPLGETPLTVPAWNNLRARMIERITHS